MSKVQEIPRCQPLGVDTSRARDLANGPFQLEADLLDLTQVGPQDLDSHGCPDPRGQHVDACLDGHREGIGHPGDREGFVHLVLELLHRHPRTPLGLRLQVDHRLEHLQGRRVRRRLGPPRLPVDQLHLGNPLQQPVLDLQQPAGFRDGKSRHRDGHVKQRPLVEWRHELRAQLHEGEHGEGQQDAGARNDGFAEREGKPDRRLVDPVQDDADWVLVLGPDPAADEHRHQGRRQRDGHEGGKEDGEGLRVGQGLEEPPRLGLKREDRQEGHGDDQQGVKQRRPDLLCRLDDDFDPVAGRTPRLPFLELFVCVFHHDDGRIHHLADGDRNTAQAHDVGGDVEVVHADERNEDGHGKRQDGHQGRRQVKEKDGADDGNHDGQFDELVPKRLDGVPDQVGSVIGRDDLDALGKSRLEVADLLLDAVQDIEDILAEAHHHDARGHLAPSVQIGQAPPHLGPEAHPRHVAHEDGRSGAVGADGNVLDVFQRPDVAPSPYHVLGPGEFQDAPFHIAVAFLDGLEHLREGHVVRQQPRGIDGDLVLLDEPPDGGHLGDSGNALQGQLEVVVLDGAQLGEIMAALFVDERIGEPPAQTRRIGPQDGVCIGGELPSHGLEVFEDAAARPVDVRPLFEDDVDEGAAQEGETADDLYLRRRQERR